MSINVFISSVQKEFAEERSALSEYLHGDALMRRFFEPFLFEAIPAADRRAAEVYQKAVEACDIYIGLLGDDYGIPAANGISPTEREFELATARNKVRLIFVKGLNDDAKHPKMKALIQRAGTALIRRRFTSAEELLPAVYASLVQVLADRGLLRSGPFDAAPCANATIADLDEEVMERFIRQARRGRAFPLREGASSVELLTHLNLLNTGRPSNAAVLLFARQPQRFLITSEVKCAHFHGTEVSKPIPSYHVYKGTVFCMVDQAVDFVLSKISISVGARTLSTQAPVSYELPPEAVREAIVNAVAHRDYTSNGSVQVMLFADRLEVWNPGSLPPSLTLEKLRLPHGSVPANPLLAEPLYLAKYIERMGTGTRDMIRLCRDAGLREPKFNIEDGFIQILWRHAPSKKLPFTGEVTGEVTSEVTSEVIKLLQVCRGVRTRKELQKALLLRSDDNFRKLYLVPALEAGLIAMTIPGKPNSRLQKYRLTASGKALLAADPTEKPPD